MAIVAVNVYLIQRAPLHTDAGAPPPATSGSAGSRARDEGNGERPAGPAASGAPGADADAGPEGADAGSAEDDAGPADADAGPADEPPKPDKPGDRRGRDTVEAMAKRACSTAPIEGLSRQIVAEARCLDASAFARVPARRNLESSGHVLLYLDAPAREALLRVLDAHPNRVLKVHSALRTVAQQYLLSRWAAEKRCGIQLATRPGESNHETGLALDVGAYAAWRSALESEGFRWLGSIDRVHFDFVGPGATHHDGLDVHAFQRLWNRNHRGDLIAETGRYDVPTEVRLKKSPARGFPIGARCGGAAR
jgi:hypothetical protein